MENMPNSGGGAALGLAAATYVKNHYKKKEVAKKNSERAKRKMYRRTGGRKIPKIKSKQKKNMSEGGKSSYRNNHGKFALKVQLTRVGDSPHYAIQSVCDCSEYFTEIHVVLATSERKNVVGKALKNTYGEDTKEYANDMKLLKKKNINLIIHTRSFDENKINVKVRQLVDVSAFTYFTSDHFEEWLKLRLNPNFGFKSKRNRRYSMKCVVDESIFTLWTPLIVTLMIFNWWRSFFSQMFRSKHGVDMNMYPIHHDTLGPFIPDEKKSLGCVPTTGFLTDRDPRLSVVEGPRTFLPGEWSGFERFMWLCQRQDRFGLFGIVFGFLPFIWFFAFPYWNILALVSPVMAKLTVETFAPLRIGVWVIHSIFCVLALPTIYKGPLQNLVVVFMMPLVIMFFPFFLFYGMLFYNGNRVDYRPKNNVSSAKEKKEPKKNVEMMTTENNDNEEEEVKLDMHEDTIVAEI